MKKLGVFNVDGVLKNHLMKQFDILDMNLKSNVDAVFIDWIPNKPYNAKKLILQANIIKKYINKIPITIFDRYLNISENEQKYFSKNGIHLFEPALNNRINFEYLPFWIENTHEDIFQLSEEPVKSIDLYYDGSLKNTLNHFEKYFVDFKRNYPKISVQYRTDILDKNKTKEYNNIDIINKKMPWDSVCYSILIDDRQNYNIGYLNSNVFDMINAWCVPLIPKEHRWFRGLFDTVHNIKDVNWHVSNPFTAYGALCSILNKIDKFYPEFKIEYTVDRIVNNLTYS